MSKILYLIYLIFLSNFLVGQSLPLNDTLANNLCLRFDKIKPNVEEFNMAEMSISYEKSNSTIKLYFVVPNYYLRYKTTPNDYILIETSNEIVKLQNEAEIAVAEGSISFNLIHAQNYFFVCSVSKALFIRIFKDNIKKLTFCFAPNENFIKERLSKEKFFDKVVLRFIGLRAGDTIKYSVSQPNGIQYQKISEWLTNLN